MGHVGEVVRTDSRVRRGRLRCGIGWLAETLSLPEFHPADSFFDLGGESMEAAKLARRIRTVLGVEMTMRMLLEPLRPRN
ncbi:acyl carrier protein [Nocardia sp. NBC_00508]|uniref:acyl carrier protein n=1 Tax=Nocardia sp. NBC_00508 TaxID=2975992 RepID=UPI002E809EE5|nr:acyl carrier protein [Nocardia sp. NBC_00508]WUD70158.1 acyl carrier protein [Nocardia sp. NBC_00508]